ncbi:WXG100 family type VII secretion target [Nocardia sp. CA-129566]|uniref:WXG100 family type VII secretion target n=1 Tax=Nocardia sp. CA-129566 TaxID=3239976 RepID=UPI003D96AD30
MVMRVNFQGVDQHTAATFDATGLTHDTLGQLLRHVNEISDIYQSNGSTAFKDAHVGFHTHLTRLVDNLNDHTNALNDAIVQFRQVDDENGMRFRVIGA